MALPHALRLAAAISASGGVGQGFGARATIADVQQQCVQIRFEHTQTRSGDAPVQQRRPQLRLPWVCVDY